MQRVAITKISSLNTLLRREFGNRISRQSCLASKARLNSSSVLKPRPPSECGVQNFSHAIQRMPLLFSLIFHQKLAMALLSLERIALGSKKYDITYVERARTTKFMRISLPLKTRIWLTMYLAVFEVYLVQMITLKF